MPQVREGGFYPQSLERGTRSERALKLALAEMYVQGVSTRKVAAITEQLCGFAVSSGQVSQAAKELDATLEAWRSRPLAECPYLLLDARYEKVRQGGHRPGRRRADRRRRGRAGQAAGAGRLGGPVRKEVHWRRSCKAWSSAACAGCAWSSATPTKG